MGHLDIIGHGTNKHGDDDRRIRAERYHNFYSDCLLWHHASYCHDHCSKSRCRHNSSMPKLIWSHSQRPRRQRQSTPLSRPHPRSQSTQQLRSRSRQRRRQAPRFAKRRAGSLCEDFSDLAHEHCNPDDQYCILPSGLAHDRLSCIKLGKFHGKQVLRTPGFRYH